MNIYSPQRNEPEINLTPLIDVVFLLLIFFMISTTFIHESELKIDLPEAKTRPVETQEAPIQVDIDRGGKIAINGKRLINNRAATFMAAMRAAAGKHQHPHVIISADAQTDYQSVVTVLDLAQQLGFERLSLATIPRRSNP